MVFLTSLTQQKQKIKRKIGEAAHNENDAKHSKSLQDNHNLENAVYQFDEKKAINDLIESAPKVQIKIF